MLSILHDLALAVFTGWGQTKVVEDAFQRMRDREERDVKNRKLMLTKRWSHLRDEAVIRPHARTEITPPPLEEAAQGQHHK
eukprot:10956029-Lingulodinium_polyedra.AAC.1